MPSIHTERRRQKTSDRNRKMLFACVRVHASVRVLVVGMHFDIAHPHSESLFIRRISDGVRRAGPGPARPPNIHAHKKCALRGVIMLQPGLPERRARPKKKKTTVRAHTQGCERKPIHTSENVNKSARRYIAPVASPSDRGALLSVCRWRGV